MNKRIKPLVATLVTTASLAGFGKEIYSNDFATRSSHKGMPGPQWYVTSYSTDVPGPIAYRFTQNVNTFTPLSAYENLEKIQDGWTMQVGVENRENVNFSTRTIADDDNPCVCASNIKTQYNQYNAATVIQPFYNFFSSGILRAQVDMKFPQGVGKTSSQEVRLAIVCDGGSPSYTTSTGPNAMSFGMIAAQNAAMGGDQIAIRGAGSSNWGYCNPLPAAADIDKTHWYRIVADLNLGNNTFTLTAYDMGTVQPSLSTPTPTSAIGTSTNGHSNPGTVSALGLRVSNTTYKSMSAEGVVTPTQCPAWDNIRLWWRPTAGSFDDSNLFYENDFKTRRVRTLAQGSKSATYSDALETTDAERFVYAPGLPIDTPNASQNLESKSYAGHDDWRRRNDCNSYANLVQVSSAARNVLALVRAPSDDNSYVQVKHPLGRTISEDYIKVEFDMRSPNPWEQVLATSYDFQYFALETASAVSSSDFGATVRLGMSGSTGYYKLEPYYRGSAGVVKDTSTSLTLQNWYRARAVLNRTVGTFDYELYDLGSASGALDRTVPETPVYTIRNVAFNKDAAFTHISFSSYNVGKTWAKAALFDNVRIWTGSDDANWSLIYQNDFNERIRYGVQTVQEAKLLAKDVNRIGLDGWIRRGAGVGDMYLRNAANPYITVESESSFAHAVHTLKPVKKGKVVVRADIRPPSRMTADADYPGCVYVGGDEYAQGEIGTQSGLRTFTDAAFGCFGFVRSGEVERLDFYTHARLFVKGGGGEVVDTVNATLTDWYRFVATFDLDAKTWRVDVYDQGTAQPVAGDEDGTLVKSFENLTFVNDDPSGFSAIGIAGGGTAGDKPLEADKRSVLFDNVNVTCDDFGLMFLVK